jgi:hypothetical protein
MNGRTQGDQELRHVKTQFVDPKFSTKLQCQTVSDVGGERCFSEQFGTRAPVPEAAADCTALRQNAVGACCPIPVVK